MDLQGVPYWGKTSLYGGGGYIADLSLNLPVSRAIISELRKNSWIDRNTRAIFVEFTIYNPFVNLFCWTNILFEYLPEGGVVPSINTKVFKLYLEDSILGGIMVIAFFAFLICVLIMTVRFILHICRKGKKHFSSFTPWLDFSMILLSISVITLYISMYFIAKHTLGKFRQNGRKFTQFHPVVAIYDLLRYIFGFLLFVSTIRLLTLLRIMRNIKIFGCTLRSTLRPFAFFFLQFSVIYVAYCHVAHLIFCRFLYGYISMTKTLMSVIAFAIKQQNVSIMRDANPILGSLFYITFVLVVIFGLMNIFIATLVHYHHIVKFKMKYDVDYLRNAVTIEVANLINVKCRNARAGIKDTYRKMKKAFFFYV